MVKAIFFDVFNVLIKGDFPGVIKKYENEFNLKPGSFYKVVHDFDGWKKFSLGNITQDEFFKLCDKRAKTFKFDGDYFFKLLRKNIILNHEMADFIRKLSRNYIIGVISNSPKEWYDSLPIDADIKHIINVLAISGYLHVRKPDKKIFTKALELAGVKGNEAIYVDDRADRVGGALDAGMKVIVFDGGMDKFKNNINNYLKHN